jgi:hypothetical protein
MRLVMVRSVNGALAGQICPETRSWRTRRRWYYNGWAAKLDQLPETEREKLDPDVLAYLEGVDEQKPEETPSVPETTSSAENTFVEPDVEDGAGATEETVTAVSAEEGEKGWWTVTFDDGTTQKMRKSAVEALGLLEADEDG